LGEAVITAYNAGGRTLPANEAGEKEYGKINGIPLVAISAQPFMGEWKHLNILRITPQVSYEINEGLAYPEGTDPAGLGRRIVNRLNEVGKEITAKEKTIAENEAKMKQIAKKTRGSL